jgi:hypothetical protein
MTGTDRVRPVHEHLVGDVPTLWIIAVVLAVLIPRKTNAGVARATA